MPSIVIREKDLTKGGGDATATDVVLVPGFMNTTNFNDTEIWPNGTDDAPAANTPVYCDSVAKFERCFGAKPPVYVKDCTVADLSPEFEEYASIVLYKEGAPEKSYLYAKELLNQGMPVMYVSANGKGADGKADGATEVSAQNMLSFLSKTYAQFKDKSEYDVKFITSGGYPTLEVSAKLPAIIGEVARPTGAVTFEEMPPVLVAIHGEGYTADTAIGSYELICTDGVNKKFTVKKDDAVLKTDMTFGSALTVENTALFAGDKATFKVTAKAKSTDVTIETPVWTFNTVKAVIDGGQWADYHKAVKGESIDGTLDEFLDNVGDESELTDFAVTAELRQNGVWSARLGTSGNYTYSSLEKCGITFVSSVAGVAISKITPVEGVGFSINFAIEREYEAGASGGLVSKLIDLASGRGDAVALIDHINIPTRNLVGTSSIYPVLKDLGKNNANSEFATAFTPWVNMDCVTLTGKDITHAMPASFGYLMALANSNKTNANWVAIAGATRGQIPNISASKPLTIAKKLTNSIAENEYQNRNSVSINAITNINPFGYRIWGNRTLKDNSTEGNLTATSFLNVRNMVSDVKKTLYRTCKKYMFEQNNDILWANFKADIELTLNKMKTGAGISSYKIIKGTTTEKAKLVATVRLYPIYAVEDFDITVTMEDEEISMS